MKLIENNFYRSWQEYWLIFRYHPISAIGSFLLTIIVATTIAIQTERSYEVSGKIKLKSSNNTSYSKSFKNLSELNHTQELLEEGIFFLSSPTLAKQVIEKFHLTNNQSNLLYYPEFIQNLNITQDPNNQVINITYTGDNFNQSELIVNFLIKSYIDYYLKNNQKNFLITKNILIGRLKSAENQLHDINIELKNFLKKNNQDNLNSNSENNLVKLNEIEQKISHAKTKVKEIDTKIRDLRLILGIYTSPSTESSFDLVSNKEDLLFSEENESKTSQNQENLVINKIQVAGYEIEVKKNNRDSEINSNNYQNLLKLTEKLIDCETEKKIWLSKLKIWEDSKKVYQEDSKPISLSIKKQYQDLLAKKKAAENNYKNLLIELHQLEIISKLKNNNLVPTKSVFIKKSLKFWNKEIIIISGIAMGFILSFTTAFIVDRKNSALKTSESIKEIYNVELLGKIPNFKKLNISGLNDSKLILPERSVLEAPYSIASEAHKIVYQNLQSNQTNQNFKLITISSSGSQEGKSTFSANLAAFTAKLGKKILLIDANFYEPRQHEIWQVSNHLGLIDLLKNNTKLDNIIQSPSLNIDIITTGFVIGDGLSLLQSETMKQLVNYVKRKYDLIIFDTPSITLSPNALTINKFTDGMVLVERTGVSKFTNMTRAKELINKSQQIVLGLVVNDKMAKFNLKN